MRIFGFLSFFKTRKKLSFFLIFLIIAGLCYYFFWYKKTQDAGDVPGQEQEIQVHRQDIISSLSLMGKSKIKNEQSLNFNTPRKVTAVYVELGQQVEKNTLLAEIDKKEVLSAIEEKRIELEQAELKYENLLDDTDIEVQKMQQDVESKKRELEKKKNDRLLLEAEQNLAVKNKEIALDNLRIDIEKMQQELQNDINALKRAPDEKLLEFQNLETSLTSQKKEYDIAFAQLDAEKQKQVNTYNLNFQTEYLALTNFTRNLSEVFRSYNEVLDIDDDYEVKNEVLQTYFSVKNVSYVSQAKQYYKSAKSRYEAFKSKIDTDTNIGSVTELLALLEEQKTLSEDLYQVALAISS